MSICPHCGVLVELLVEEPVEPIGKEPELINIRETCPMREYQNLACEYVIDCGCNDCPFYKVQKIAKAAMEALSQAQKAYIQIHVHADINDEKDDNL